MAQVSPTVAGIDGCSGGWLVIVATGAPPQMTWTPYVVDDFQRAIQLVSDAAVVAIDVPIGLSDQSARMCDVEARRLLGRRACCVFPSPVRAVLSAVPFTYTNAKQVSSRQCGKSITMQTWAILPKITEVDSWIKASAQDRVIEVHPELCFWALNGQVAIADSKRSKAGRQQRERLLQGIFAGFSIDAVRQHPNLKIASNATIKPDDVNDAFVAAWTAYRRSHNVSGLIPAQRQVDRRGLRMEMHY